jgi:hypothetical protein
VSRELRDFLLRRVEPAPRFEVAPVRQWQEIAERPLDDPQTM